MVLMKRRRFIGSMIGAFITGMLVMAFISQFNPFTKINEYNSGMEKLDYMGIKDVKDVFIEDQSKILDIDYIGNSYYYLLTEKSQYIVRMSRSFDNDMQGFTYEYYKFKSIGSNKSSRNIIEKVPILDWMFPPTKTYKTSYERYENDKYPE